MSNVPPGWHPDPHNPSQQRYWDGSRWTEHSSPGPGMAPATTAVVPPKKSGAKKILIPILACLALLIIAGVVVAVMGGGSDGEKVSSASTATTEAVTTVSEGTNTTTPAATETTPETTTEPTQTTSGTNDNSDQKVYKVGETATTAKLKVTLNTVKDPYTSANSFDTPGAGKRYVAVELTVENTDSEQTTFSSIIQAEVSDSLSRPWKIAFAGSDLPQLDGDIAGNAKRRGWMVFEVATDSKGLQLRMQGSFTAVGSLFDLG